MKLPAQGTGALQTSQLPLECKIPHPAHSNATSSLLFMQSCSDRHAHHCLITHLTNTSSPSVMQIVRIRSFLPFGLLLLICMSFIRHAESGAVKLLGMLHAAECSCGLAELIYGSHVSLVYLSSLRVEHSTLTTAVNKQRQGDTPALALKNSKHCFQIKSETDQAVCHTCRF